MKSLALSAICAIALATGLSLSASASPPGVTGTWVVQQDGLNGGSNSKITLTQSGNGVVGTNAVTGTGFTGEFVGNNQINAKWHGPSGAGWITVYVSANGHSFNGTWGYNGRKATGSFVGNKVLPPSPITAVGKWDLKGAGDAGGFVGPMSCTQSSVTVVCHIGSITLNGKFRTNDKVRATWTAGDKTGWFSFWFNGDNNSFNGIWGNGADTTPPVGRVVGQRTLGG
jgi:hypothetical protein